jgi:DNA-binding GntR family transcriptional regulator
MAGLPLHAAREREDAQPSMPSRTASSTPAVARGRSPRTPAKVNGRPHAALGKGDDAPIRSQSLTAQAYARIEEMIVTLQLPPGMAISEAELSQRLGIGRTPVREALQRLAREHLVSILPQRGNLVSEIDIRKQLRLLETRREVERLIARCAARRASPEELQSFERLADEFATAAQSGDATEFMRADKEFNDLSLRAARNEFAAGAMGLMHGLSRRFWFLHYRQAADLPAMAELHSRLARAIARRDEAAAAQALDALLDNIEAFTRATVSLDF